MIEKFVLCPDKKIKIQLEIYTPIWRMNKKIIIADLSKINTSPTAKQKKQIATTCGKQEKYTIRTINPNLPSQQEQQTKGINIVDSQGEKINEEDPEETSSKKKVITMMIVEGIKVNLVEIGIQENRAKAMRRVTTTRTIGRGGSLVVVDVVIDFYIKVVGTQHE